MIIVNPFSYLSQSAWQYWRLLDPNGSSTNFWDIDNASNQANINTGTTFNGTNLASGLVYQVTFGFGDPAGYVADSGSTGNGNPFSANAGRIYMNAAANQAMHFNFGGLYIVNSLKWTAVAGNPKRQPTAMILQVSPNDVDWANYAILNNPSQFQQSFWRTITSGGTIAATSS